MIPKHLPFYSPLNSFIHTALDEIARNRNSAPIYGRMQAGRREAACCWKRLSAFSSFHRTSLMQR